MPQKNQSIPYGCKISISKREIRRKSLHQATIRISLSEHGDYVCKLKKELYGLNQAPKIWYLRLDGYSQQRGFRRGNADNNLYIKMDQNSMITIEVYVDGIIFGSDDDKMTQEFSKDI